MAEDKRVQILQWLLKPEQKSLRVDYQDGKGFHVCGGRMIEEKGKVRLWSSEELSE